MKYPMEQGCGLAFRSNNAYNNNNNNKNNNNNIVTQNKIHAHTADTSVIPYYSMIVYSAVVVSHGLSSS